MNLADQFWASIEKEEAIVLATSAAGRVTMRTVSPVRYTDAILIFTGPESLKYQQLKENPNGCLAVGGMFLEVKAEFMGPTLSDQNQPLREVYAAKFQGAFDENIAFGGRTSDFILLHPVLLKSWGFENGEPTGPVEYSFT